MVIANDGLAVASQCVAPTPNEEALKILLGSVKGVHRVEVIWELHAITTAEDAELVYTMEQEIIENFPHESGIDFHVRSVREGR